VSRSPDVTIIGGGVVGLTIARSLAHEGLRVALLERGLCGSEASGAGAGIIAPCNPHRTDTISGLHDRSLELYPRLCEGLLNETDVDPEYECCGELSLLYEENVKRIAESDCRAASGRKDANGKEAWVMRSPTEVFEREPLTIGAPIVGALECRVVGQVRSPRLIAGLKLANNRAGVEIVEGCEGKALVMDGTRVTGVATSGATILSEWVVLAGGAWSSQLHPLLARSMPVHPIRGQIVMLKADHRPCRRVLSAGKKYLVPRRDGHLILGATEEPEAGYSKRNTASGILGILEAVTKMAPGLGDASVVTTWAGLRPGTPDDKPYIGPVVGLDGLVAATGHFRAGLTLAPATAELVAAMITGRPIDLDLSQIQPGRPGLSG
jgi:glycine oxidase